MVSELDQEKLEGLIFQDSTQCFETPLIYIGMPARLAGILPPVQTVVRRYLAN